MTFSVLKTNKGALESEMKNFNLLDFFQFPETLTILLLENFFSQRGVFTVRSDHFLCSLIETIVFTPYEVSVFVASVLILSTTIHH